MGASTLALRAGVVLPGVRALGVARRPPRALTSPGLAHVVARARRTACARGGEDGVDLTRRIVRAQWAWLDARIGGWIESLPSSNTIETLGRPIVGLLAAAALAGGSELQAMIVERLTEGRGYPIVSAIAVLRAGSSHRGSLGLGPLRDNCMRSLTTLTSAPLRAPTDWSISTPLRCKCELCVRLGHFLRAANEQQLEWPLAQHGRAHVHQSIANHELPITHVTRRIGSPYTLVLTKKKALCTRDAAERATWIRDLAWLRHAAEPP